MLMAPVSQPAVCLWLNAFVLLHTMSMLRLAEGVDKIYNLTYDKC